MSNLPNVITEDSFVEFMSKCGMVEFDIRTKKPKVKIYRDEEGSPKGSTNVFLNCICQMYFSTCVHNYIFQLGDGLCSYIKPESVQLALTILDGSVLEGKTVSVTRAKFEMKGNYDPTLKPKKLTKKQQEKAKKARERMFEWQPDKLKGERAKCEKTIVIKKMFDLEEFDKDPGLILDYTNNIRYFDLHEYLWFSLSCVYLSCRFCFNCYNHKSDS